MAVVVLEEAAPRPQAFQDLLDSEGDWPDHYRDLLAELVALNLGFSAEDVAAINAEVPKVPANFRENIRFALFVRVSLRSQHLTSPPSADISFRNQSK